MKKKLLSVLAAGLFATTAFAQDSNVIAIVNGQNIVQKDLNNAIKLVEKSGTKITPEIKKTLVDELIQQKILVQQAEKEGIDKDDETLYQLAVIRNDVLIANLIQKFIDNNPVTKEQVKARYDELVALSKNSKEYNVNHILVKDEDTAKNLISQINSKKIKFADAAKQKSIDPGSKNSGGNLGWSVAEAYVPEFAQAVINAPKGKILSSPVKTQFGYHVILVQDSRAMNAPPLKDVEADITQMLEKQKVAQYVESLRNAAKVENK